MPPQVTRQVGGGGKVGGARRILSAPAAPEGEVDPWAASASIRMLVYGASGTGKTTFASTFPGPTLWLLCSGGNRPGELKSIDTAENRAKITPKIVSSTGQLIGWIAGAREYTTVVLDHASGLADLILKEILGLEELPAQKGWGLASQQQYGQLALQCKETFRALLNLPGHVVILAQERVFGAKEEGGDPDLIKPTVGAALTPSVTGWLNPACDFVVQTFRRPRMETQTLKIGNTERQVSKRGKGIDYCLRIGAHDIFQTKFRTPGGVPCDEVVNPSFGKIEAVLRGEVPGEER